LQDSHLTIGDKILNKDITLTILGGGREIGANSYLLEWNKHNIILDCGLNPRKSGYEALPAFDILHNREIDAIIITHAHLDHIGSLPFLVINYLKLGGKVYMTPPNVDLIPHMLKESVKAVERGRVPEEEQYYYHEFFDYYIVNTLKKKGGIFKPVEHDKEFQVTPEIKARFFHTGHILGSAGVLLSDGEYTFNYTGDICKSEQTIHYGCSLPEIEKTDCLLIESTHGSDIAEPVGNNEEEYGRLAKEIRNTAARKGHVLIPSFGLGRTQNMVVMISRMKQEGLIPEDMPVFFHFGVTAGVNDIYDRFSSNLRAMEKFKISSCCTGTNIYRGKEAFKKAGDLSEKPAIFVFTSGMLARRTPAAILAGELVRSEKNGIFFCGYAAPNELGYELLNIETGQSICLNKENQEWVKVVCPHIYNFSFSAHANRNELVQIAEHFKPDLTLWIHGGENSSERLSKYYGQENNLKSYAPDNRETVVLRIGSKNINNALKSHKAILVTVGTSLLTTYLEKTGRPRSDYERVTEEELIEHVLENIHNLPSLSAETNSLSKKKVTPDDFLYFISGDNDQGRMCGNVLKQLYDQNNISRLIEVEGLRPEAIAFKEKGMTNLLEKIVGIIEMHGGNAVIHATGGFKAQIALATLLGILFKSKVYYLYEDFNEVVSLPEIPLDFDYHLIFAYKDQFFSLTDGREYWKVDEIYARLPEMLKLCFYKDEIQRKYYLTPLGRGIFNSFQRYMGDKIKHTPVKVNGKSSLWGDDHDSLGKILNPVIGMLIERLSRYGDLIKCFEFSSVPIEGNAVVKTLDDNYLEYREKGPEKLVFLVHHKASRKGIQDILTIVTSYGTSSYLLNIIGRKIYP
jgi:putative CRISPR-associated protein (TIGR02619 family)